MGGMDTTSEREHITHKGACSGAGSFPHQRERARQMMIAKNKAKGG